MAKVVLFDDHMLVSEVDPDGKKFDKGVHARSLAFRAAQPSEQPNAPQCRAFGVAATSGKPTCRWT